MVLLLASAVLLVTEAPAARMSLLDLIGVGSRKSSPSRSRNSAESRKRVRVEHTDEAKAAATNAAFAAAVPGPTNGVEIVATDDTATAVSTNMAAAVATNGVDAATNSVAAAVKKERESKPAHISSKKVYYDRKEGYAVFTGKVFVDGEDYQLHTHKAYVFFEGTNELKRIVATGGVAITNDTKRAYGAKASYYRKTGMVVLYGDEKAPAEVRNESNGEEEDQVVKGSTIKFWIDSEQVEVVDARISAPVSGDIGDLKKK